MPNALPDALTVALDVAASLRAHLALDALALAVLLGAARRLRGALVCLVAAAVLAAGLRPVWTAAEDASPARADAVEITLVSANLLRTNPRMTEAREALLALDPDILVLIEVPWKLESVAAAAFGEARLSHALPSPHGDIGISVLAERPYRRSPPIVFRNWVPWHLAVDVRLDAQGRSLRLVAFHFPAPFTRGHALRREGLPDLAPLATDPLVAVGDFDAAPWTRTLARTAETLGAEVAGGWRPSWFPSLGALGDRLRPWLGLPIDNLLTSPSVQVLSLRVVPIPGSDHLAQVARLRVTWPSTPRPPSATSR